MISRSVRYGTLFRIAVHEAQSLPDSAMSTLRMPLSRPIQGRKKLFDPKAFLSQPGIGRTVHQYTPKQAIFSQGEASDAVFYIQTGKAKLSVVSKQGKEATIALLDRADFLGEGCIASDQSVRMDTATAITRCSLLRIEKKQLLRTLHAEHEFSDLFVVYVVRRHNRTQADL